ncbi:MAG: dihydrolipoyllysine-residue succinyltransferase [Acidobacteriota bacterium]
METKVLMPQLGESITEGTVTKWFKKIGESIKQDEPLFEVSTDKVDTEIPSPVSGTVSKILVEEGKTVTVGSTVAMVETELAVAAAQPAEPKPAAAVPEKAPTEPPSGVQEAAEDEPTISIRATPLVKRIAREHEVDLKGVPGTGAGGRVTKRDVLAAVEGARQPAPPAPAPPAPAPRPAGARERRERMSVMRQAIAEHMVMSKRVSPHLTTFFEVDMAAVTRSRDAAKDAFRMREGFSLTYMPYIASAAVASLKHHPAINSSVEGTEIIYKDYVNLGIAVALEGGGLIVPVVKGADERSFLGLARAIQQLAEAARTKKLSPDDVKGGTFTITNFGVFGSLFGTPIINQPQTAILGVGAITRRPVVIDDAIAIRPMVYLSLTFDHRAADGSLADPFLAEVKSILEHWKDAE